MFAPIAIAAALLAQVSGSILLDVQSHGEAWYVYPVSDERYFLGRPQDAFDVMRYLGLGITDADLAKIPVASDAASGDLALRRQLSGRILLQVQQHGEAWYVYPNDLKRYYLGRPADAFQLMRNLGLGISQADLAKIPVAPSPAPATSAYRSYTLTIDRGAFDIRVLSLNSAAFDMVTDGAESSDCSNGCPVKPLDQYVAENAAVLGMHGTYFCPSDYPGCVGKTNSFFWPFYDSASGIMRNTSSLAVHHGPLLAYSTDGSYRYFHRAADFGSSVADFERRTGTKLAAAVANYPSLLENDQVVVWDEPMLTDDLKDVKATRGAIGIGTDQVFLVIVNGATVPDLAYIMRSLGAHDAMNLDGGGSAALYDDGAYRVGPGRALPNAIVFKKR